MGNTDEQPGDTPDYDERLKKLAESGPLPEVQDEEDGVEEADGVPIGESVPDEADSMIRFDQRN
ncbi:MAG: hypothetical protein ACXVW7_18780 [Trebonia sp.]